MKNVNLLNIKTPETLSLDLVFSKNYKSKNATALRNIRLFFELKIPVCLFMEAFSYHPVGWSCGTTSTSYKDLEFYEPTAWKGENIDDSELTASGTTIKDASSALSKTINILSRSSLEILQENKVRDANSTSILSMAVYKNMYFSVTLWDLVALRGSQIFEEMSFGLQDYINTMLSTFEEECQKTNPTVLQITPFNTL